MTVSPWLQTNFSSQDSTTYKGAIDGNFSVLNRLGNMFSPYGSSSSAMTVFLSPGHVYNGVMLTEVTTQTSSALTAPVSQPRTDRAVIDQTTGVLSIVAGTESSAPTAPAIPANKCPVAQIALQTSTTSLTNSLITDERDMTGLGLGGNIPPYGVSTNSTNNYSVTTAPAFSSLSNGTRLFVKINAANTGSATLNANSIGAKTIKDNLGNNLAPGYLLANSIYEFLYDGTNFILINGTKPYVVLGYAAETGSANAYIVAPSPAILTYAAGQTVILKPGNANTGASTLQVSGITAGNIKLQSGADPWANALVATGVYMLIYDGTNWVLQNPSQVNFTGDSGSGGAQGLVPAPGSGDAAANKVLGAGGGWVTGLPNVSSSKVVMGAVTVQFGNYTGGTHSPTITFGNAFSSTPYSIQCTPSDNTNVITISLASYSNSGFVPDQRKTATGATATDSFFWVAWGPT